MKGEQEETNSLTEPAALIVVGELNVDLIFEQVNELPTLEKERCAENMTLVLGSSSAILASNARALGMPVGFVGRVGMDMFGDFVVRTLAERAVDTSQVHVLKEVPTGATVVYTYESRRGMLTYPGAMNHLTIDDIPWEYVSQAQHLHVSSLFLQRGLRRDCKQLFSRAKKAGLTTSLDTGWDPQDEWLPDVRKMLEVVDIFLPNADEARRISEETDLQEALHVLASQGSTVIITCGADGVLAKAGGEVIQLPAISVEMVDSIGAGDSFNAGFLKCFLDGRPLEESLQYGLLAGAFSTRGAGGTAAFVGGGFETFVKDHRSLHL